MLLLFGRLAHPCRHHSLLRLCKESCRIHWLFSYPPTLSQLALADSSLPAMRCDHVQHIAQMFTRWHVQIVRYFLALKLMRRQAEWKVLHSHRLQVIQGMYAQTNMLKENAYDASRQSLSLPIFGVGFFLRRGGICASQSSSDSCSSSVSMTSSVILHC